MNKKTINKFAWISGAILLSWLVTFIACAVLKVDSGPMFNIVIGSIFFMPWIFLVWLASIRHKNDDIDQCG